MALIICTECGKRFSDKAPACPECGCPTDVILKELNGNDESVSSTEKMASLDESTIIEDRRLNRALRDTIINKVIGAKVNGIEVDRELLYNIGMHYNCPSESVDLIVKESEEIIERYYGFLDSIVFNNIDIMLSIGDDIESDAYNFAKNLGLSDLYVKQLYDRYLLLHRFDDKRALLKKALDDFKNEGEFSDRITTSDPNFDKDFNENEYKRFKSAIMQMCDKYTKMLDSCKADELSSEEFQELFFLGVKLGFNVEDIDSCLFGVRKKLGVDDIIGYNQKQRDIKEQGNVFGRFVKNNKTRLLGRQIIFESCYFVSDALKNSIKNDLLIMKKRSSDFFKSLDYSKYNVSTQLRSDMEKVVLKPWGELIRQFVEKMECSEENRSEILFNALEYYSEIYEATTGRVGAIQELYTQIVTESNKKDLDVLYATANRGRWVGGGFGIKGAIKGRIQAGLLNAGSDALHGMIDSYKMMQNGLEESRSKNKLGIFIVAEIDKLVSLLVDATPLLLIDATQSVFYYSVYSMEDKWVNYVRNRIKNAKSLKDKISWTINLLKEEPTNAEVYQALYVLISENSSDINDDVNNLLQVAKWFKKDVEKLKESILAVIDLKSGNKDLDWYIRLYEHEKRLGVKSERISKTVKEIRTHIYEGVSEYTPEEVDFLLEQLRNALGEESYYYQVDVEQIRNRVIKKYDIDFGSVKSDELKRNIEGLKNIISEYSSFSEEMSKLLQEQENSLNRILEQEDISARTVEDFVTDYNISSSTFVAEKRIFATVDEKEKAEKNISFIKRLCEKLDKDIPVQERDEILDRIKRIQENGYCGAGLHDSLKQQYDVIDKIRRDQRKAELREHVAAKEELEHVKQCPEDVWKIDCSVWDYYLKEKGFNIDVYFGEDSFEKACSYNMGFKKWLAELGVFSNNLWEKGFGKAVCCVNYAESQLTMLYTTRQVFIKDNNGSQGFHINDVASIEVVERPDHSESFIAVFQTSKLALVGFEFPNLYNEFKGLQMFNSFLYKVILKFDGNYDRRQVIFDKLQSQMCETMENPSAGIYSGKCLEQNLEKMNIVKQYFGIRGGEKIKAFRINGFPNAIQGGFCFTDFAYYYYDGRSHRERVLWCLANISNFERGFMKFSYKGQKVFGEVMGADTSAMFRFIKAGIHPNDFRI